MVCVVKQRCAMQKNDVENTGQNANEEEKGSCKEVRVRFKTVVYGYLIGDEYWMVCSEFMFTVYCVFVILGFSRLKVWGDALMHNSNCYFLM